MTRNTNDNKQTTGNNKSIKKIVKETQSVLLTREGKKHQEEALKPIIADIKKEYKLLSYTLSISYVQLGCTIKH